MRETGAEGSLVEAHLEALMAGGLVTLCDRVRGTRTVLESARVRDVGRLAEWVSPGELEARRRTADWARAALGGLDHPVAERLRSDLEAEAPERMEPDLLRALVAVATHVTAGAVLPRRVLSTRSLGDSKALDRLRGAIERRLGPLEDLGIRDAAALALLGGHGNIVLPDARLNVAAMPPYVGLSEETLDRALRVEAPAAGALVIENLTVFEACCREEVLGLEGRLVLWSGGYPGRAVRRALERLSAESVGIWADLDLDGVRIARLIRAHTGGIAEAVRMGPDAVEGADVLRPLSSRARRAIETELAARPEGWLAESLRAMLARDGWVEQEGMLAATDPSR